MAEDEQDLEDEEEEGYEGPDYVELAEGLYVFSAAMIQLATNSLAIHVVPDAGVFFLDATTLEWKSYPLAEPAKKSRKLGPA